MLGVITWDLDNRLFGIFLGITVGTVVTWLLTRWRLAKARASVLRGDAGDLVVIEQHIIERGTDAHGREVPRCLRRRYLGQRPVHYVIPNPHLAGELQARNRKTEGLNALISMEGAMGSYLLESLCGFVCHCVSNQPFDHDLYVMAPCREPATLAYHKPVCVILIATRDLEFFLHWDLVKNLEVEHASDGVRLLTLMDLAMRWKREQELIVEARQGGRSVRHLETMFLLDLALDPRSAPIPTRSVPWPRFGAALSERGLPHETATHAGTTPGANPGAV